MTNYLVYPEINDEDGFPPGVNRAIIESPEAQEAIAESVLAIVNDQFEPALPLDLSASKFLRGDKTWQDINIVAGVSEKSGFNLEVVQDASRMRGPAGTRVIIPTPQAMDGESCHPSVLFFPDKWNGYRYWMAMTPYPAGNDNHEDPCIVASQDGITWVVPVGQSNPIDDADGMPAYNSDVDLKMGPENTLYLFWRFRDDTNVGAEEQMYYSTSTDGVTWAPKINFLQGDRLDRQLVSPSLIFEDGKWTMYAVDIVPSPNLVVKMVSETAYPEMGWGATTLVTTGASTAGREPWHLYVLPFGGRYYMLRADCLLNLNGSSPNLQFLSSSDGNTFIGSGSEVIPMTVPGLHDQLYRATMVPAVDNGVFGFRVWYTGWTTSPQRWWMFRTFISATDSASWVPVLLNTADGWTAYSGGGGYYSGMRYKRVGNTVTLEGTVKNGISSSIIAYLPPEARPASTTFHTINANGAIGMLQIFGKDATGLDIGVIKYFLGATTPNYVPFNITYQAA